MKRIGITQRVVYFEDIDERRDMLDQRWYDFAQKVGFRLLPIPNKLQDLTDYIEDLDVEGFIFREVTMLVFLEGTVKGKNDPRR
ncbi:MAG: hypothetical protein U5J95_12770 [Balneolaceae bacterium]|nr:hypothetical protein [Balneolaceae bacterium]